MVANMGVAYPQLLKDACGQEEVQGESTGQLASPHTTLYSFASVGKIQGNLKKEGQSQVNCIIKGLCLKKIPTSLGLCLWLGMFCSGLVKPFLKGLNYPASTHALMVGDPGLCHFSQAFPSFSMMFRFPLKCHVFFFCLSVSQSALYIPIMMQASVGNSLVTWDSTWFEHTLLIVMHWTAWGTYVHILAHKLLCYHSTPKPVSNLGPQPAVRTPHRNSEVSFFSPLTDSIHSYS